MVVKEGHTFINNRLKRFRESAWQRNGSTIGNVGRIAWLVSGHQDGYIPHIWKHARVWRVFIKTVVNDGANISWYVFTSVEGIQSFPEDKGGFIIFMPSSTHSLFVWTKRSQSVKNADGRWMKLSLSTAHLLKVRCQHITNITRILAVCVKKIYRCSNTFPLSIFCMSNQFFVHCLQILYIRLVVHLLPLLS